MSCIRDNKVCTKCCEVIHIPVKVRDYLKYYGKHSEGSDTKFVRENFKPMKRRIAKKKNPYMFTTGIEDCKHQTFWKCKSLSKTGCTIYNDRTRLCKGYPWYDDVVDQTEPCTYTPSCTEYYAIPIKMVE